MDLKSSLTLRVRDLSSFSMFADLHDLVDVKNEG